MEITLNTEELNQVLASLYEMPAKFANPIIFFLESKIQEVNKKNEASKKVAAKTEK